MELRVAGISEMIRRITDARSVLGINAIKHLPTRPIDEKYLPCIFVLEGDDNIVEYSSRNTDGYPARRIIEVTFELVGDKHTNIMLLYSNVRKVLFSDGVVVADNDTFIRELRTEGPSGYGLPDVLGIRMVIGMFYKDSGI